MNEYIGNRGEQLNQQLFEYLLNTNSEFKPQIAQIADEDGYLEGIPSRKYTVAGLSSDVILRRYKVRICSMHDSTTPISDLPYAYAKLSTSGLRRESCGITIYPKNTYVTVYQHPVTGNLYIDEVHPNTLTSLPAKFENACAPGSGINPQAIHFEAPTTAIKPQGNGIAVGAETHLTVPCKFNEQQNTQNEVVELGNGCKKVNTEAINKELSKLIKDVQKLKSNLTGKDSFLGKRQQFLSEVQAAVNNASANISNWVTWVIQEIRKYVNRKINAGIRDVTGNAPLSQRYLINAVTKETLNTTSCLFVKLLQNLENIIRQILNAIIDKVVNTAECVLENLLGNLIGQILSQLTSAINSVLGPISSLVGAVISFTNEILDFVISILDFLECKIENVCPTPTEWNFLEGAPPPKLPLDFNRVFQAAKGVVDSTVGVLNIPQDLNDFNFVIDANSAFLGVGGCLGFGPQACGVPNVVFWGGSGAGAAGNAVLNAFGDIIGVDIISPGNYSSSPVLAFEDNCGNGVGAYGIPILGDVEVPVDGTTTPSGTGGTTGVTGTATTTITGITDVVMIKTGYGYLPSPDGSKGGMGRTWTDRCQTIVRRANGDWDPPYNHEDAIKLFFGDMIQLPGKEEVYIDCDFRAEKLPGCNVVGTPVCLKSMIGFDDNKGIPLKSPSIKSMVGFDDFKGASLENTSPISPEHQRRIDELLKSTQAKEAFDREKVLIQQGAIYRPNEFDYINDYAYAKEQGFSDQDIRFYLEGFYSKILGKKISPLMQVVLNDPNFGSLPKYITGSGGAGVFDYENDYPYAVSLGFSDQDIRYYLENFYTGIIADDMQRKLNDSSWGRIPEFYVTITAPDCPPQNPAPGYEVITTIGDIYVEDGGFGFAPGDTATLLDCSGVTDAATKIEIDVDENGTILKARVLQSGTNYTCIPEIRINTQTGYNARLKPILRFRRATEDNIPTGTIPLKVIDCVGKV